MADKVAPATPSTLSDMAALQLRMKAYNTTLRTESVLNDVFEKLSAGIQQDAEGFAIPDAVFMKLDQPVEGAYSITVPMLLALKGKAQLGADNNILSHEENLRMKHLTVYFNEVKKGVSSWGWGVEANNLSWLNIYARITPLMTDYFRELRGRRIREALMLTYSEELTMAPTSCNQLFNPNIFIPNTDLGNLSLYNYHTLTRNSPTYPAYYAFSEGTSTDYQVSNIEAALDAATDGYAHPEYTIMDMEALLALDYYCKQNLLLEPLNLGGKPTLIFLCPVTQMIKMLDPTGSGNIGSVWKDVSALTKFEQAVPDAYCRVRNLLLCEDERYPTLTVSGTAEQPILTPGFVNPGNELTGRNNAAFDGTTNKVFDVGSVLGKGGIIEWVQQQLKYATESTEYGKINGKGAYQLAGIQLAIFNEDTMTNSSYLQRSSCMVLMARPVLVNVT
jgi:hypothetical protein